MNATGDDELLAEQVDFYRADAAPFDAWLGTLLDDANEDPTAVGYRAGRAFIAERFAAWAPLGHVLEIAAGTGRLVPLYAPHARAVDLLDASPESLTIAATANPSVRTVHGDVFDWDAAGRTYDTIVFTAWLHHVPHARFDAFWHVVGSLLAPGGRVVFDVPDAAVEAPGATEMPDVPSEDYGFYAPVDGISVRDNRGRRWRVVHNLWHTDELVDRMAALGWSTTVFDQGLFGNVRWMLATKSA